MRRCRGSSWCGPRALAQPCYATCPRFKNTCPNPAAWQRFGIERRGDRLDYNVVVLGYGGTGERVVDKLNDDGPEGVDWSRSSLLEAWGYRLSRMVRAC